MGPATSSSSLRSWCLIGLIALLPACAKKPSPAYEEAADQFSELYRQKWDEAYGDPGMAEIEAKLETVPKDSLNAPDAEALLKRIREGRARLQAEAQERERDMAAAVAPTTGVPSSGSDRAGTPAPSSREQETPSPDAGGPPEQPKEGMPVAELSSKFGNCFREGASLNVMGKGMRATWSVRELPSCLERHPGFASSLLVIDQGKVYAVVDKNALDYRLPDGGKPAPGPKR
jgi:hypothetical protein